MGKMISEEEFFAPRKIISEEEFFAPAQPQVEDTAIGGGLAETFEFEETTPFIPDEEINLAERAGRNIINTFILDPLNQKRFGSLINFVKSVTDPKTPTGFDDPALLERFPTSRELAEETQQDIEQAGVAIAPGVKSLEVPPAETLVEKGVDIGVGVVSFLVKLALVRKVIPPNLGGATEGELLRNMMAFEAVSAFEGESPGKGSILAMGLGATAELGKAAKFGTLKQTGATAGLFGTIAAAENQDLEGIITSALIGGGLVAIPGVKKWWKNQITGRKIVKWTPESGYKVDWKGLRKLQKDLIPKARELLGVKKGASSAEIQAAYRQKALTAHPDAPQGSEAAFKALTTATDLLTGKLSVEDIMRANITPAAKPAQPATTTAITPTAPSTPTPPAPTAPVAPVLPQKAPVAPVAKKVAPEAPKPPTKAAQLKQKIAEKRSEKQELAAGVGIPPIVGDKASAASKAMTGQALNAIRADSEQVVKKAVRTRAAKTIRDSQVASKWEKGLSESDLEDIGAMVEGVGNLAKGDTIKDVKARMTPRKQQVLKEYKAAVEANRREVNEFLDASGKEEYIKFLNNYLPHFYAGGRKKISAATGGWVRKNSPNAKQRKIPTLADAQDMGLKPLTQNIATLHRMWSRVNWQVATTRKLVQELKELKGADGKPLIRIPSEAPEGWIFTEHPAVSKVFARKVGGKTLLWRGGAKVDPDAWRAIRQVLDTRFDGPIVRAIEGFNAFSKKALLSFSLFHHIALSESSMASVGPAKGVVLFGKQASPFGKKAMFTYRAGLKLLDDPKFLEDATRAGLVLDSPYQYVSRVMRLIQGAEAATKGVPVVGKVVRVVRQGIQWWDHQLWDKWHRGLKVYGYYDNLQRELARAPEGFTEDQIKEEVAKVINDAYGGQEWQTQFWLSPKAQQVSRMTLLALDWTASNARIAFRPVFQHKGATGRIGLRYWRNMAITLFMTHQLLNLITSGKWTWENEEGHKFDIDVTDAIRKLPWRDPNDKQRFYIHFGKQAREVIGWVQAPFRTLLRKLSPAAKTGIEQVSGYQVGTTFPQEWMRDEFAEEDLLGTWWPRSKAIAKQFVPFSLRGNNFAFAAPMSKGMTPWKARKALGIVLRAHAEPGWLHPAAKEGEVRQIGQDIVAAAELNGHDGQKLFRQALGSVKGQYLRRLFAAGKSKNTKKENAAAKSLIRLGTTTKTIRRSAQSRGLDQETTDKALKAYTRNKE